MTDATAWTSAETGSDGSHISQRSATASVPWMSASPTSQLGLLDLSVGLSVPEVYSGTEFTLYLHVKNPFARPVWIKSVELSLPTQLSSRESEVRGTRRSRSRRSTERFIRRVIRDNQEEIRRLNQTLLRDNNLDDSIRREAESRRMVLQDQNRRHLNKLSGISGDAVIHASPNASVKFGRARASTLVIHASEDSSVRINDYQAMAEPERVPLLGSLPQGAALQPGSTDVWTIRLGSGRNPFFIPARYHLQFTVIYSLEKAQEEENGSQESYSNTTSFTVPVRAALWSVILGGIFGGIVGSIGRSLQGSGTVGALIGPHTGTILGALALSVILSGAAVIFSARKAEAQSFITVEDFWGGVLVGFLIGYSGTAAFTHITGIGI